MRPNLCDIENIISVVCGILFSDRGTPYGYRHMNGYSSHTFKWVNKEGKVHYVKYHFKTDQGIKNFTAEE